MFVIKTTSKLASHLHTTYLFYLVSLTSFTWWTSKVWFFSIRIINILTSKFLPFTWHYFQLTPKQLVSFTHCHAPCQHILLHFDMSMSLWAPCFKWISCQSIFNCFFFVSPCLLFILLQVHAPPYSLSSLSSCQYMMVLLLFTTIAIPCHVFYCLDFFFKWAHPSFSFCFWTFWLNVLFFLIKFKSHYL